MGGSSYLYELHGLKKGLPPRLDLAKEIQFQNAVRSLIHQGKVRSAHDLSDGGLAVALAESCFATGEKGLGAKITISRENLRSDILLFNETQGRAILSVTPSNIDAALAHFRAQGVDAIQIGSVTADGRIGLSHGTTSCAWSVKDLEESFENSLPSALDS